MNDPPKRSPVADVALSFACALVAGAAQKLVDLAWDAWCAEMTRRETEAEKNRLLDERFKREVMGGTRARKPRRASTNDDPGRGRRRT